MGSEGLVTAGAEGAAAAFDADRIRAQLRRWQERLLDLTRANPLLSVDRSRVSKLRVSQPSADVLFERFVVGEGLPLRMPVVRKIHRNAVADTDPDAAADPAPPEDEYEVDPGEVTFDARPVDVLRRLRRIYDNGRTTVEERGVTTLYLTFGILVWEVPDLGVSRSPVWLVPCELESAGSNAPLRLKRVDDEMQLNPALELYMRERQKVTLPPPPEEPQGGALDSYLNAVRTAVAEHRWSVEPEVWLSTYSFESLVIYQDLKAMVEVALVHPIVAALARASSLTGGSETLGEEQLDVMPNEAVPVPVLPTDSSQLKGLALAMAGRNLVVHGPPGTGKSQTISNLIADALGAKKTVLFVSAKMAALNVVYARLAERGLGRFCLEAHSTKAGKAKIMLELKRTLEAPYDGDGTLLDERLEEFVRLRDQLNGYVREVHERRQPLGLSLHQAFGRIERLRTAAEVRGPLPWTDPLVVTRGELAQATDALADLAAMSSVYDQRATHPWRGFMPPLDLAQPVLETDLRSLATSATAIAGELRTVSQFTVGLDQLSMATLRELGPTFERLARTTTLPPGWAQRPVEELATAAALFTEARDAATRRTVLRGRYAAVLKCAPSEALALLAPLDTEFSGPGRYFKPSFWRWRSTVRAKLQPQADTSHAALRSYQEMAQGLREIDAWFAERQPRLEADLARRAADEGSLGPIAEELTTAAEARAAFARVGVAGPADSRQSSDAERFALQRLSALTSQSGAGSVVDRLTPLWTPTFVDDRSLRDWSVARVTERLNELLAGLPKLQEWLATAHSASACQALGLQPFLDALGTTSATHASAAFQRRFFDVWANAIIAKAPSLTVFAGVRREQQLERFREVEGQLRSAKLGQIKTAASEPARRINSAYTGLSNASEVGLLRRELEKRRRIKPLRRLFAEIPQALQALKPCMLMSPLSVSTFLKPGAMTFDLVVFDEASQLPTQEAIPSILRATQVVVAGDANQLPPTSYFATADYTEEQDPDEDLEPLQSLLDDCVAIVPVFDRTRLLWHYRSRDERLIKFSNREFYDNALITFPGVTTDSADRGVRLVYVPDGIWDRGHSRTNRREAAAVADTIIQHLETFPQRSLGVVALNATQREAIEDAVKERIAKRPDLQPLLSDERAEPYFVKSLEHVQGDERDTMIISVGYAKTADGSFSLNFGPLNQDGGWRRLNVLVTRAKWQTILVTSIRSIQLDGVNPNNRGACALRDFIAYVERGGEFPARAAVVTDEPTNEFEDAVAEALVERGLIVEQQVGASGYSVDIGIRDPRDRHRFLLGVECDGATYHSAKTARDRDLLRQLVLRDHGWRLHRLWSTDWFRDREKTLTLVLTAYERALQAPVEDSVLGPSTETAAAPVAAAAAVTPAPVAVRREHPAGEPYLRYRETNRMHVGRDVLMRGQYAPMLSQQIEQIVAVEAPMHVQLLTQRLRDIHGIARAGVNIQANIDKALDLALRRRKVELRGSFVYLTGQPVTAYRYPADEVTRSVALVAPEELERAILHIVEDQFGYPRDAIPHAVAEALGFERSGATSAELIASAVDGLVERGALRASGPNVSLP